ncbi:hypothetical protein J3E69DRAFT_323125 [Trichoderma sp. SZMC 28015]
MSLEQLAPSRCKAFVFTEELKEIFFRAHSCGNGRFIRGDPSPDLEICFRLHKHHYSLNIQIHDVNLLQWLRAIPSLRDDPWLRGDIADTWMDLLLPHYPELSAKFDQDRREGRSFEALELFVRHFLHGGSVFETFGLEHLHKSGILTDLHLDDILSQNRPMSEDLDLLDEAVDEIDEPDIKGLYKSFRFLDEPFQFQGLTAIRRREAQERRTMTHRLLAEVTRSCVHLLDANTMRDASDGVKAFVNQVGTSASVWKSGIRAIRDICEGYMPHSLSDIVSALQVANAMRSVVPPSRQGYSKKEFIDDLPRWASLLSLDDQLLFFEIALYLWRIPTSADSFVRPSMPLRDIDERLVRTSGLFDNGSGPSYRLQTLRQQYLLGTPPTLTRDRRLTLVEWDSLAKQTKQGNPPTNAPKCLMAGAIFGVILLYLCLSRYGFSTLRLPILISDVGQGWISDQITARNNVILAMYARPTSHVEFESCKSTEHLLLKPSPLSPALPDGPPTERVREHMVAVQASYEGEHPTIDPSSVVDTVMDCSPGVSSHLTASSPAVTMSTSSMTTATSEIIALGNSMDGMICCGHCNSKFKLGKNGRRGQASNLQKHMKIHHPETIPDYHRVIYNCRYGCGTRDPNKSNIKAHENKHCANRKGKQPRRHGKWR